MKRALGWGGMALALILLGLSVTNASWIAPYPAGAPKQIAHRAFAPEVRDAWDVDCQAKAIEAPHNRHIANTRASILRADRMGAWLVEVDPQVTSDGEVVLLTDADLSCATDGTGLVSDTSLEDIQALDAGFGYQLQDSSGTRYPYRGQGLAIPTLKDIAKAIPRQARLMVHLTGEASVSDAVARAFEEIGRDPQTKGDGFYGDAAPVARIREIYPDAWAFTAQEARQCTSDYLVSGWIGIVPSSCAQGTMLIALDEQLLLWGWPNRLIARTEAAGVEIIIEGPGDARDSEVVGITLPEQLTEVPSSFNGFIWTDDAFTTLPALIQRYDNRKQEEIDAAEAALDRRRAQQ